MCVQAYGSNVLIFVKQVLNEKNDDDVAMVRPFREQVGDGVVGFIHEIIDRQQRWLPAVKVVQVWQTLMERHHRILGKQLLIFFIAVDDSTRRRIHHLTTFSRSRQECRERMAQKRNHIFALVGVVTAERRRCKPRLEAIKALIELTNSVNTMYTISRCCCCCCRSSTRQSR